MALVDELQFHMKAGGGGDGVVRWRHEKGKEFSGAAGGNGGKGGDVFAIGVRDIGILNTYRNTREFSAGRGQDGMKNSMHGKDGEDLVIKFPIGSVITNLKTGKQYELLNEGDKVLLLNGGRGGLGNEHFKASTNTTPKEWTPGKEGEEADFRVELRLIADAGIIGLPNAGKTSLLNALTNSRAKVGNYQFTTLEPNLGDLYGFILADIPGLIEGASEGKGLGHAFLRHIRRTRILLHCLSLESPFKEILKNYETIRNELNEYDKELSFKKEIIIMTKSDSLTAGELEKTMTAVKDKLKKPDDEIFSVSVIDDSSVKSLSDSLVKILRQ